MAYRDPVCRRHRFSAEIIVHAVWLYFRFPLSLRLVEDMLAAQGIIVSHQTPEFLISIGGKNAVALARG